MSSSFWGISEVAMVPQTAVFSQMVLLECPPHSLLPEEDWPILTIGGSSIIAPASLFCVAFFFLLTLWVGLISSLYINHCRHHYPMAAMCVMITFYANSSRFRIAMETQLRHVHEDVSRKI